MEIKTVIQIKQPIGYVFQAVLNPEIMPKWLQGFKELKPVKGQRPRKGSISEHIFEDAKGKMTVTEEVLYYEKNKEFQIQLSNKNMVAVQTFSFVNHGDTTHLILTTNTRLIPAFLGIVAFLIKRQMRRQQEADLFRLKAVLEKR